MTEKSCPEVPFSLFMGGDPSLEDLAVRAVSALARESPSTTRDRDAPAWAVDRPLQNRRAILLSVYGRPARAAALHSEDWRPAQKASICQPPSAPPSPLHSHR